MNLNKVFVLGNVTRDPETRAMPSGQQVVNFGMATNRFYTDQGGQKKQEAEFHNIVAFGKLAETISRYVTKGSLVMIEGRIKTRSWNNQQGIKQYRTEIITEGLQLGPRQGGNMGASAGSYQKPAQTAPQAQVPKADDIPVIEENNITFQDNNPQEIDVKDIPF